MVKNSKCWIGKFNRFRHTYSNGNSCFYFLNEKMKLNGWIGGGISFIGIALISFSQGDAIQLNSGGFFILLAAISESLYFVFQTSYLKKYGFLPLRYIQFYLVRYVCLFSSRECIQKY